MVTISNTQNLIVLSLFTRQREQLHIFRHPVALQPFFVGLLGKTGSLSGRDDIGGNPSTRE
jgi:hypothetical protein